MVLKPEPIFDAVQDVLSVYSPEDRAAFPVILMSPQGRKLDQQLVLELGEAPGLVLICGHYAGVDERVRTHLATHDVSIGDYVLTGGELAAMVIIDCGIQIHTRCGRRGRQRAGRLHYFWAASASSLHETIGFPGNDRARHSSLRAPRAD